jgi:hypothetical protein
MWVQLVSPVGNLGGYPGRRAIDFNCLSSDRLIMVLRAWPEAFPTPTWIGASL